AAPFYPITRDFLQEQIRWNSEFIRKFFCSLSFISATGCQTAPRADSEQSQMGHRRSEGNCNRCRNTKREHEGRWKTIQAILGEKLVPRRTSLLMVSGGPSHESMRVRHSWHRREGT